MFGYIYITTNLLNGKRYIGEHRGSTKDPYYYGSGTILLEAIKKYGKKNFINEVLEWCSDEEELHQREIYWIKYFDAVASDDFYNIAPGGVGTHSVSLDARKDMSVKKKGKSPWNKGKKLSQEYCDKVSSAKKGSIPWNKGLTKDTDHRVEKYSHKCSEEAKAKISAALSGKPSKLRGRTLSQETVQKISAAHKGKTFSADARKKMSAAKSIKVMCVETGVIYDSMILAGLSLGFKSSNPIYRCVKNPNDTVKGYHWKIVE